MTSAAYTDPRLAAVYDALNPLGTEAQFYARHTGAAPKTVLELGCGTGAFAVRLSELGHQVTGTDPAAAMLGIARHRPGAARRADPQGRHHRLIISPATVVSPRCQWEVDRTVEMAKHLIPVQWKPVPEADVPVHLKRLNYTIFTEGQTFAVPPTELAVALRQDVDWIREHTRLGELAARWQVKGRAGHGNRVSHWCNADLTI